MQNINLLILEKDLRVFDNPALQQCISSDLPFLIVSYDSCFPRKPSQVSFFWLIKSLSALKKSLKKKFFNIEFEIFYCLGQKGLKDFVNFLFEKNFKINQIFFNESGNLENFLQNIGNFVLNKNYGNFLIDFQKLNREFKIFTPFYKHCLGKFINKELDFFHSIENLDSKQENLICSKEELQELQKNVKVFFQNFVLKPKDYKNLNHFFANLCDFDSTDFPIWWQKIEKNWDFGEEAALRKFKNFIQNDVKFYKEKKDFLSFLGDKSSENFLSGCTSKLSTHIHFGEISVRFIFQKLFHKSLQDESSEAFLRQIFWREFAYNTLFYHQDDLYNQELRINFFENFSWAKNSNASTNLEKWKKGETGFPIVDAAMRGLWQTGWMHGRARMIVASFLVKNLLIDWREGESWFFETLVDADDGINAFSWQWVAGCGTDSSPYFRIFNPVLQSQKFDPEGIYIKKFVPELSKIDISKIHKPWEHFRNIQNFYFKPIVDLSESRKRALYEFAKIKNKKFN